MIFAFPISGEIIPILKVIMRFFNKNSRQGWFHLQGGLAMSERFDNFQVKVYEALRNAIFEAIHNSQNVKSLIKIIQDHQMLDDLFGYMESLEIRQIIEGMAFESMDPKLLPEKETPDESVEASPVDVGDVQRIDGRKISVNEKLFEEFYQATFNEEDWLKMIKIRF